MSSGSKRRLSAPDGDTGGESKKPKVHPFFEIAETRRSASPFWQPNIGKTCKYGINRDFRILSKIAAFDLDGTLIKTKSGKTHPTSAADWQWWRPDVPQRLKNLHASGYAIVVLSNQMLSRDRLAAWVAKIPLIAESLPDLPFLILAATDADLYRKPKPGMWWILEHFAKKDGIQIDKESSFFVGDAAGRPGDHSASDRKLAINLGLRFHTPEEYFLSSPVAPFRLEGFCSKEYPTTETIRTPSDAIAPGPDLPEIVLFVGPPGAGKTTFFKKHFEPLQYIHVNQDQLKRRDKCVRLARDSIKQGQSCVIDNTNRDPITRKFYINIAKELTCSIRCILFKASVELAWHNVLFRTWMTATDVMTQQNVKAFVPKSVLLSFRGEYEEPTKEEGFQQIIHVDWRFEGEQEQLERWQMWLE